MWQRACPWCQAQGVTVTLEKKLLSLTIHCECGWTWGAEPNLLPHDLAEPRFLPGEMMQRH